MPINLWHKKVGLVEINNSFSGQTYLPYSLGSLQAYSSQFLKQPRSFEFLLPIYCRLPVEEAVQKLETADIIFFSTYVWNLRISLEIAKRLKILNPKVVIIFGGPQVPDRPEAFLRAHRCIDLVCHNEGEQIFLKLLESLESMEWQNVPGISYINEKNELIHNKRPPRLNDLSACPSPFLGDIFVPLMKANPEARWITAWETNRGCPFTCAFCDWGSATAGRVYQFNMEKIYSELEWFGKNKIEYIFCADANFGMLPRDLEIASYAAEIKKKYGYPFAMSVQNTKNATDRAYQVQKMLAEAGLNKGVTISFQSVDPTTLQNIKRGNISSKTFHELQRRFTKDGVETYSDLILGLPGETFDSFADGISLLISDGQHNRIQFNNLSILPNAEMGDPEYQKKYGMVTVETKIINIHGYFDESHNDVWEMQELVVATNTMPKEEWVRVRAFAWLVNLLHFNKILQIPIILLHEVCGLSYREIFEIFFDDNNIKAHSVLSSIKEFFLEKAKDIQNGGAEYCYSKEWLSIWWPADEYIFIKLSQEGNLDAFYSEVEKVVSAHLKNKFITVDSNLLHEAVMLNKSLLKTPFQNTDLNLTLSYNIWEFYIAVKIGERIPLEKKESAYHIDRTTKSWSSWDKWCEEVVWYGNKKGAYLYGNTPVTHHLEGHY